MFMHINEQVAYKYMLQSVPLFFFDKKENYQYSNESDLSYKPYAITWVVLTQNGYNYIILVSQITVNDREEKTRLWQYHHNIYSAKKQQHKTKKNAVNDSSIGLFELSQFMSNTKP